MHLRAIVSLKAIRQIAGRYNQQGKEGLVDHRHQHPGPKGFLCDERPAQAVISLLPGSTCIGGNINPLSTKV